MNDKIPSHALFEVSLKLVVKDANNKILLLKVPDNNQMAGYFDLPGGRINESEKSQSLRDVIKRELAEELGTDVQLEIKETPVAVGRHNYFSKNANKTKWIFLVLFEALYKGGEIQISSEHKEYEWVDVNVDNLPKLFTKGPLEAMSNYITGVLG